MGMYGWQPVIRNAQPTTSYHSSFAHCLPPVCRQHLLSSSFVNRHINGAVLFELGGFSFNEFLHLLEMAATIGKRLHWASPAFEAPL